MKKINLSDLPKKRKVYRRVPSVRYHDDNWHVHTVSDYTQSAIADYLNRKSLSTETKEIYYKGEPRTCFEIQTLEMLLWLRKNGGDFTNCILHRKKGTSAPWRILNETTRVK